MVCSRQLFWGSRVLIRASFFSRKTGFLRIGRNFFFAELFVGGVRTIETIIYFLTLVRKKTTRCWTTWWGFGHWGWRLSAEKLRAVGSNPSRVRIFKLLLDLILALRTGHIQMASLRWGRIRPINSAEIWTHACGIQFSREVSHLTPFKSKRCLTSSTKRELVSLTFEGKLFCRLKWYQYSDKQHLTI